MMIGHINNHISHQTTTFEAHQTRLSSLVLNLSRSPQFLVASGEICSSEVCSSKSWETSLIFFKLWQHLCERTIYRAKVRCHRSVEKPLKHLSMQRRREWQLIWIFDLRFQDASCIQDFITWKRTLCAEEEPKSSQELNVWTGKGSWQFVGLVYQRYYDIWLLSNLTEWISQNSEYVSDTFQRQWDPSANILIQIIRRL